MRLPVENILEEVTEALTQGQHVLITAPPGSGKTTLVPSHLYRQGFGDLGEIVLVQPRRLAARAVASLIADRLGVRVGAEVGYHVRFDRKCSDKTIIRVVTEGILLRQLQRDPSLEGVGTIILDEFHERSLNADLSLGLLQEVHESLRPDIRLAIMSATLNVDPLVRYLPSTQHISTEGRAFPVEIHYAPHQPREPLGVASARWALKALERTGGDVLVFLPGVREIKDAARTLGKVHGTEILQLHGRLPAKEQDIVLRPSPHARIVLATNIAETSLTVPGIKAVVDSGRHKSPEFDAATGTDRLALRWISKASAEQRAGRAGRLEPGHAWRMWTEHHQRTLATFDRAEIERLDLTSVFLQLFDWGEQNPATFRFLDPPAPARSQAALRILEMLGAISKETRHLTDIGRAMAKIPTHPRLARFLVAASVHGVLETASILAALVESPPRQPQTTSEHHASDLIAMRQTALSGWYQKENKRLASALERATEQATRQFETAPPTPRHSADDTCMELLLVGWPDRVAMRRETSRNSFVLASGRAAKLSQSSRVQSDDFILALDVDLGQRGDFSQGLIRVASRIDPDWLKRHADYAVEEVVTWDEAGGRVRAQQRSRFRSLVIDERPKNLTQTEEAERLLLDKAKTNPRAALALKPAAEQLLSRIEQASVWSNEPLEMATRAQIFEELLPEWCSGRTSFAQLRSINVYQAITRRLPWKTREAVERLAPETIEIPSGRFAKLAYRDDGPPLLRVKVQEMYGATESPKVGGGRIPVVLHLLNPASRELQITQDLASFWESAWPEVRKQMRARYPKHLWPENPATAEPSQKGLKKRR